MDEQSNGTAAFGLSALEYRLQKLADATATSTPSAVRIDWSQGVMVARPSG
ncbi:MAG: hypothetical protein HZY75_05325 [Nocardioidaceae bacterium]|nr:MAG: hypothetical protein HZY75_05325 [Nocardioidaceae bacterium]